ncbi:MAG: hypothetical protein IT293_04340 [Deltaproteobacteria bacterium]|nr:hypothetical protein [Deltaproteobacteria bacterium]
MWVRVAQAVVAAAILGATLDSPVRAETCGDADGGGDVSVSDGVQVLRAAAGIDAPCPPVECDVDGSGGITVTDGVNVLRTAAGLDVQLRCSRLNAQETQVFGALQKSAQVTRLVALGLDAAGGGAAAAATVPCPNGGTMAPEAGGVVYEGCRVRSTICSGGAAFGDGTFAPGLECRDLSEDRLFSLTGTLTPSDTAAGRALSGTASGTQGSSPVFEFDYDALALDESASGGRASGQVEVGGAFFSGAFERVQVSFPGRNPATGDDDPGFAKIVGLRSGGSVIFVFVFDLNLATGKLTAR